jgi:hypothetical protein
MGVPFWCDVGRTWFECIGGDGNGVGRDGNGVGGGDIGRIDWEWIRVGRYGDATGYDGNLLVGHPRS